jgi:hypothetical protein
MPIMAADPTNSHPFLSVTASFLTAFSPSLAGRNAALRYTFKRT